MDYRSRADCGEDEICRVVDVSVVGGDAGEAWLCAPAHEDCKFDAAAHNTTITEEDFLDDDIQPPEEYAEDDDENTTAEDLINEALHANAAAGTNYNIHRRRGIKDNMHRRRGVAGPRAPANNYNDRRRGTWKPNPNAPPPPKASNSSF